MTTTHETFKTTCSGCATTVQIEERNWIVRVTIPSNGVRGAKHVPAHEEVGMVTTDEQGYLLLWDCPACGYADSFDPIDGIKED